MPTVWCDEYASFDTETTGLGAAARIVEVGVVTFVRGEIVREWSTLIWPGDLDWDSNDVRGALAVNHLTREELVGKPTFADIMPQLFLELDVRTWCAHNAEFDVRMLNQELDRMKQALRKAPIVACTKNLSSRLNPGVKGHKLSDVAPRYGVVQEDAHRAIVDARACGRVLSSMLQRELLPRDDEAFMAMLSASSSNWNQRRRY